MKTEVQKERHPSISARKIMFALVVLLTLFRVWLACCTPLFANTPAMHDDQALMNMALQLIDGNWLGDYSQYTLMKGMIYPLFCAFCAITRIPYVFLLSVCNIAAAYMFVRAVRKLIRSEFVSYGLYLFLIYSPIMFEYSVTQRIYRNALTAPLVLFIFAGISGVYLRVGNKRNGRIAAYAVLAGVSLFLFWNLREDSIWIMPFVIVCSILTFVFSVVHLKKTGITSRFARNIIMILLPFVILIAGNFTVSCVNYVHYGVFAINDRTKTAFNEVTGLFIKIDYEDTDTELDETVCFMSEDKFAYIIDHSESLSEYKDIFLEAYERWARNVCTSKYVYGDHIQWSFRLGLADAGFYTDGKETQEYLKKVAKELNEQIQNGDLQTKSGIFLSNSTKMISLSEIPDLIGQTFSDTASTILTYENVKADVVYSSGENEEIRKWEWVVNSDVLYPDEESRYVTSSEKIVGISNAIIRIYRILAVPLCVIAIISWIILTVLQIFNIKWKNIILFHRWIISCAAILSAFVLMFIFTVFTCWNHTLSIPYYCSGAYVLVQIFQVMSIYSCIDWFIEFKNNRRRSGKND